MPPHLPATDIGVPLTPLGRKVTIELFVDFTCPYSTRMLKAVDQMREDSICKDVSFVVQHVPQPFHPQGIFVHEASLAVYQANPAAYPSFMRAAIDAYESGTLSTNSTWNQSRGELYSLLVDLVKKSVDEATAKEVQRLLAMNANGNNAILQSLIWACKYHRTRGVHVTPTVHINGLEAAIVSSGWTAEQWLTFLGSGTTDGFTVWAAVNLYGAFCLTVDLLAPCCRFAAESVNACFLHRNFADSTEL
eukprot:6177276-Pleurochrysis_carterae.AAC.3